MAIISFWNNVNTETGKTLSLVAIATYMAIMHNSKILVVETEFDSDTIKDCYWEPEREGVVSSITSGKTDISTGIEGLAKAVMSNKSSPEIITNYTKIVFKDRLEVLLGMKTKDFEDYKKTASVYKEILQFAKRTYDIVLVNVPNGYNDISNGILESSDLVIATTYQKMKLMESLLADLKAKNDIVPKDKVMINLGKCDQFSKYNTKNMARYFGERKELLCVPYCTQFFEACNEGKVADYFIKYNKIMDLSDQNFIFMSEVKRTIEKILYRLQELQLRV